MTNLKPCPFCGGKLTFKQSVWNDSNGVPHESKYWIHNDTECLLNDIGMPFSIGAGDAIPENDYPGEYALKWNERYNENK